MVFLGVLYKAQQRGAAPAQPGAARRVAAWRAGNGSGNMLGTMLAKQDAAGPAEWEPTAAIAVVWDVHLRRALPRRCAVEVARVAELLLVLLC